MNSYSSRAHGRRPGEAPRPRGYKADRGALSYSKIEYIAARARRVLASDVALDAPLPGVELFENLEKFGVRVHSGGINLTYAVLDLPVGVEAETRYLAGQDRILVGLSGTTYQNLEMDQGRARHTLNHEIGHAVLHAQQLRRISVLPHATAAMARTLAHKFCEDTEWQADAFAAALEMPARGLHLLERRHGRLSARLISSMMQVSLEAAVNRLNVYGTRRAALLEAT